LIAAAAPTALFTLAIVLAGLRLPDLASVPCIPVVAVTSPIENARAADAVARTPPSITTIPSLRTIRTSTLRA
jgi:hypothetical protein